MRILSSLDGSWLKLVPEFSSLDGSWLKGNLKEDLRGQSEAAQLPPEERHWIQKQQNKRCPRDLSLSLLPLPHVQLASWNVEPDDQGSLPDALCSLSWTPPEAPCSWSLSSGWI